VVARTSPALARRHLGRLLRYYRELAGLTLDEAGRYVGKDKGTLSRTERGERTPSPFEVKGLGERYGLAPADIEPLAALVRHIQEHRGWWNSYTDDLAAADAWWVDAEYGADSEQVVELCTVPTLLQTADYARTVTTLAREDLTAGAVNRIVEIRLMRQAALRESTDPLRLCALIDEAALCRGLRGQADIMRPQLEHLLEVGELPTVEVRALPGACLYPGAESSYAMLNLPGTVGGGGVVALRGAVGIPMYIEDETHVKAYAAMFERQARLALDAAATRDLIRKLLAEG
jgi:transcriptional regulator with XRE-family HTH domain